MYIEEKDRLEFIDSILHNNIAIDTLINAYDLAHNTNDNEKDYNFIERFRNDEHIFEYLITSKTADILEKLIEEAIETVDRYIVGLNKNNKFKVFYLSRGGASVIGSHFYAYVIPTDRRKKKPIKANLYNVGYLNGEDGKECKMIDISKVLKSYGLNIKYDSGSMD